MEGRCCELAKRGYNRDGKRGKLQIVYGLLCAPDGCPVAIEVFEGNTGDPMTLAAQIDKLKLAGVSPAEPRGSGRRLICINAATRWAQ
jgi:transposase